MFIHSFIITKLKKKIIFGTENIKKLNKKNYKIN